MKDMHSRQAEEYLKGILAQFEVVGKTIDMEAVQIDKESTPEPQVEVEQVH